MINVDLLDDEVMNSICQNMGLDPGDEKSGEAIAQMSPDEAFSRWCTWHGFIGWPRTISHALDNIRKAFSPESEQ